MTVKIRPRRDWLVVLADPRKETLASGLILPGHETGVEKVTEGSGHVVSVGPGEKNQALGLEPGQKVMFRSFIKYAHQIPNDEKWDSGQNKEYFFIASEDILAVIPDGMEVGVFSGRPMVPEKK